MYKKYCKCCLHCILKTNGLSQAKYKTKLFNFSDLSSDDNHTLADKTTLYKMCEPVKRLPKCRYFKDAAWTIYSFPDSNATQQIVSCHCPKNSVTYLLKKLPYTTPSGEQGNQYQFACSPQSVSSFEVCESSCECRVVALYNFM